MNKWTLPVEKDPEDAESLVLNFPDELLAATGWKPGDVLIWEENPDKSWSIKKK